MLTLARESIRLHLESGDWPEIPPHDRELEIGRGCFVTLHKKGGLRGCVGTFDASKPLVENVKRMAVSAAFQDSRFSPVGKSELAEIHIEISVLGPLVKMNSLEDLVIGKHGVYIKLGARSGTFLPEVAVEQKWSREEFLMGCARHKAGLSVSEIAQAEVYLYEVERFGERILDTPSKSTGFSPIGGN